MRDVSVAVKCMCVWSAGRYTCERKGEERERERHSKQETERDVVSLKDDRRCGSFS